MRIVHITIALAVANVSIGCATAQVAASGPYVGAGPSVVQHHFVLESEEIATGATDSRNVSKWGIGGVAFAGYNFDLSALAVIGVEAQIDFGGRSPSTVAPTGDTVSLSPRFGGSFAGRLGYRASHDTFMFVKGGLGFHKYRAVFPGDVDDTAASFVVGGGVEKRLTERAALRLEFQHLDGTRNQFIIAVPLRF